jgi:hypothetical protein
MTYNNQRQESDMRVIPIGQSVNGAAQLRHLRRLIDQELDYRKEVTRYEMDGRTYLRVRLPECDCKDKSSNASGKEPNQLIKAMELITGVLSHGTAVLMKPIIDLGIRHGISPRTMARAKKALDVTSRKVGDRWYWELMAEGVEEDGEAL